MTDLMKGFPPAPDAQVTLANWRTGPFCHWAYHHVREIVPSADIAHDPGAVSALPSGEALDLPEGFAGFAKERHLDGLVVLHKGRAIHEYYANGMTAQAPHILFSVSKSLLGLLSGILEAEGTLDTGAPVAQYVPEIAKTGFANATVRDLLDMRSGVTFNEDYLLTEGPIVEYRKSTNWNPLDPGQEPTDLRSFLQTLTESDGPDGGVFDYKSPCTDLMAWVIERATGQRFADLFSDLLWQPMGAETPAYITVDRLGAPRAAGGICVTTRDLARVGQMLVEDGRGVVPAGWIEDIETLGDPGAWQAGKMAADFPGIDMHYRAKWYVLREPDPILLCIGIHGQNLVIDRKAGLVLAKHSSDPAPMDPQNELQTLALFRAIRDQVR